MNITEVIDRKQAKEFLVAIEDAIATMTLTQVEEAYLYIERRNAIAISFDKRWSAFIGYTRGYNQPENRTLIRRGSDIINLIRSRLKSTRYDIPGGRVFVTNQRIFRVDKDFIEYDLCKWIWLDENDPVRETLRLLQFAQLQS